MQESGTAAMWSTSSLAKDTVRKPTHVLTVACDQTSTGKTRSKLCK